MVDIERGSLQAVERYIGMIEGKGVTKPVNETLLEKGDPTSLAHLLWMCKELQKKIIPDTCVGYSVDKYSRWLGFIQGCLIMRGLTTVEVERNTTRPWFKG